LTYVERGFPKDKAKYKIIIVHGFGSTKRINFPAPQELIEELGIYFVQYDRTEYEENKGGRSITFKKEIHKCQMLPQCENPI